MNMLVRQSTIYANHQAAAQWAYILVVHFSKYVEQNHIARTQEFRISCTNRNYLLLVVIITEVLKMSQVLKRGRQTWEKNPAQLKEFHCLNMGFLMNRVKTAANPFGRVKLLTIISHDSYTCKIIIARLSVSNETFQKTTQNVSQGNLNLKQYVYCTNHKGKEWYLYFAAFAY